MGTLLEAVDVTKAYGATTALRGVSLDVRAGEVHVLAGENGAGKSTLINLLAGALAPDSGEIRVAGAPVRFRGPRDATRAGIATIHQELSLVPSMSIAENLLLGDGAPRGLAWLDRGREREEAKRRLALVGLDVDPDVEVSSLPVGAQQLVEIARALAKGARVLVLDEPTSALAEHEAELLFSRVNDVRASGRGVLYITHRMEEIYALADRITVLRDGRRVVTAPARELPRDALVRAMLGGALQRAERRRRPRGETLLDVRRASVASVREGREDVAGVSLSVSRGEIVGLFGLRGSGATELLQALFGALGRRATVDASLAGAPFAPRSPREALDRGVALLTSDRKGRGLFLDRSVRENLVVSSLRRFSRAGLVDDRAADAAADDVARRLGVVAPTLDVPARALSGGNQQKVYLGRSLLAGPGVLLLDEPTRGVDIGAKRDLYAELGALADQGVAIVILSSEIEELVALADRIVVIARGRIATSVDREDASREGLLAAAMGG